MNAKYFISGTTAFQLWRANRFPPNTFAVQANIAFEPSYPSGTNREMLTNWLIDSKTQPPYCFLVSDPHQRRSASGCFATQLGKSFPDEGSFYRIVDQRIASAPFELYIASPELSFIQMAHLFSFVQTVGYGYELCGTYTPEESAKDEPVKLLRLSSAERLAEYCNEMPGKHGIARARKALPWIIDNSSSIRETELAMMFVLSKRLRGFATMKPTLNYSVSPKGKRKSFVSQDEFSIDLCWPDFNVGIEVESTKFHAGKHKRIRDARRRNSLQYLGFTIIQATQGDLSSALGIAGLGIQLYEAMGIRPRRNQFDVDLPTLDLYKEIFDLSNYP